MIDISSLQSSPLFQCQSIASSLVGKDDLFPQKTSIQTKMESMHMKKATSNYSEDNNKVVLT